MTKRHHPIHHPPTADLAPKMMFPLSRPLLPGRWRAMVIRICDAFLSPLFNCPLNGSKQTIFSFNSHLRARSRTYRRDSCGIICKLRSRDDLLVKFSMHTRGIRKFTKVPSSDEKWRDTILM